MTAISLDSNLAYEVGILNVGCHNELFWVFQNV